MPPKKNTTTAAVLGNKKTTNQQRKYVAKKSLKVCKGADIDCSSIDDVKPVKRGLKRKLVKISLGADIETSSLKENPLNSGVKEKVIKNIKVVSNDSVMTQTETDNKHTESGSSSQNKVVRKILKKNILKPIMMPMVTRYGKRMCSQDGTGNKNNSKSKVLALNCKLVPNYHKIVRTVVNDYVPDKEDPKYVEDMVTATRSKPKCVNSFVDDCAKKIPVIKLKLLKIDDSMKKYTNINNQLKISLENNIHTNTMNEQDICKDKLDVSSNTASLNDLPIQSYNPVQESRIDKLLFLCQYTSKLQHFTGYSDKNKVDMSKKKLDSNIQFQELKNVSYGGIFPTNTVHKVSVSIENQDNCNIPINKKHKLIDEREYDSTTSCTYTDGDDDDDDTISLFAESLSGFETNPKVTNVSNIEKKEPILDITSIFKIPKRIIPKPCIQICKKQKADSTSAGLLEVSKTKFDHTIVGYTKSENKHGNNVISKTMKNCISSPAFSSPAPPLILEKSAIFKAVCIFNIENKCKKNPCQYPHTIPTLICVSKKLSELSHEQFRQECLLVCTKANLLKTYGHAYLNEAICRQNNIIVMMMTSSFFKKIQSTQERQILTDLVEQTLLYLNQVDLNEISDLLNSQFKPGVWVCDNLMEIIGQTQNFSRFKTVFVNLTKLMCRLNRSFNSDTVSQILERVCILPYSFDLVLSVVNIIKRTSDIVFCNSMIDIFERKLLNCNEELHQEFVKLKHAALSGTQCTTTANSDMWNLADKTIRYSPDTTNMDIMGHEHTVFRLKSPEHTPGHTLLDYPQVRWVSPHPNNQYTRNFRPQNVGPHHQHMYGKMQRLARPNRNQRWSCISSLQNKTRKGPFS